MSCQKRLVDPNNFVTGLPLSLWQINEVKAIRATWCQNVISNVYASAIKINGNNIAARRMKKTTTHHAFRSLPLVLMNIRFTTFWGN
jgi:hypothetical protein